MENTLTITRYKHTRNWAIWRGYELLAVTVYKRGAEAVKQLIDTLMSKQKHDGIQPGDIIENAGRRGHVIGLPEQQNGQFCVPVYFFTGKTETSRIELVPVNEARIVVRRAQFDNEEGAA